MATRKKTSRTAAKPAKKKTTRRKKVAPAKAKASEEVVELTDCWARGPSKKKSEPTRPTSMFAPVETACMLRAQSEAASKPKAKAEPTAKAKVETIEKPKPVAKVEEPKAVVKPEPVEKVEKPKAAAKPEPVEKVEKPEAAAKPESVAKVEKPKAAVKPEPMAVAKPEPTVVEPEVLRPTTRIVPLDAGRPEWIPVSYEGEGVFVHRQAGVFVPGTRTRLRAELADKLRGTRGFRLAG